MCLAVYVGAARALVASAPEAGAPRFRIEEPAPPVREAVRGVLALPFVYYAGSHTGCSCGFNSERAAFEGLRTSEEARAWIGAMTDEERAEFLEEEDSRARLRAVIEAVCVGAEVRVYATWHGDEAEPPLERQEVAPAWLTESAVPLREGVLYEVRRPRGSDGLDPNG